MTGVIGNGLSGLLAAQRALQTTGNNIANANTDGYVRQRVDLVAAPSARIGNAQLGQGVRVAGVERLFDQLLTDQLRDASAASGRATAYNDFAIRLDRLLGDPDQSVAASLRSFFDAVDAVGREPTSIANRQQLLLEGTALADRFADLDGQLNRLGSELDARIGQSVSTIDRTTAAIAALNERIAASGGTPAADLLDQRTELTRTLAREIDITVSPQDDGTVAIYASSGTALVLGIQARPLATRTDPLQGDRLQVGTGDGGGFQDLTSKIGGGFLGGLLAFRRDTLDVARAKLGQIGLGLAESFNAQHRQGLDLDGNLGGDFFAVGAPAATAATTNAGTATVSAAITDPAAVTAREYELRYNGSAYILYDRVTAAVVPTTGSGTPADPLVAEGVSITTLGTAQAGDRFLIRPLAGVATNLRVTVTDAAAIAAARPLTTGAASGNLGNASIGSASVTAVTDPNLLATREIRFDSPTSYRLYDGAGNPLTGPQAWTSGSDIAANGWVVQVTGTPAAGDRFTVRRAGTGSGDNGNAVALSGLGERGYFSGGLQSLTDLSADLTGSVGAIAARAAADLTARNTIVAQAELDVEGVSGVNLEEEAADLLRFQQAYQAAAKVIAVGDELFATLLAAVR